MLVSTNAPSNPKKPSRSASSVAPSGNGAGRKIRLHGSVVTKEELHEYVLKQINDGITGTKALSEKIGKKERQTKRILDDMAFEGIIQQDPTTGRMIKTKQQEQAEYNEKVFKDVKGFRAIPQIKTFIEKALTRNVKPKTLNSYISSLRIVFTNMKTHPASVITSRHNAEEFFKNYVLLCKTLYPTKKGAPHQHRVAYRVFLDSVANISYGHGMAKGVGFGSHHDSYQKYKGAHIPLEVLDEIYQMMLEDKEYRLYTWLNVGSMTGARTGGVATMTWERINMYKDDFRLEQFETKDDSAGHVHLGLLGEWKKKLPPVELYDILTEWKDKHAPKNSKFVWIEESDKDSTNIRRMEQVRKEVIPALKKYFEKVKDKLSPLTREYIFEAGEAGHINRHTFAQLLRNKGLSKSQIAYAGGWKKDETVDWYCDISEDEKENSRKAIADVFAKPVTSFGEDKH